MYSTSRRVQIMRILPSGQVIIYADYMATIAFLQDFLAVNVIWLGQRLNRIKMSSNESKKNEYTIQTNIFDLPVFA